MGLELVTGSNKHGYEYTMRDGTTDRMYFGNVTSCSQVFELYDSSGNHVTTVPTVNHGVNSEVLDTADAALKTINKAS